MKNKMNFVKEESRSALLKMTIPLMISLILNMTYSLVDSLWVGNLMGKEAMAALTSSTAIILLLNCIIVGLTNGISILLAQSIGAGDEKRISQIKATSLFVSILFMGMIIFVCELQAAQVLKVFKTSPEITQMAIVYLRIYLLGTLATYFYMYFTSILRCYGNTIFQMVVISLCSVFNAILDPFLIRKYGFPGVAYATVITQTISFLAALIYTVKKRYFIFCLKDSCLQVAGTILTKGIPLVIQQSIPAFSTMALTILVSDFGISALASFGIIGKMENILLYPVMALNMGLTTIISQCIGNKRPDRMNDYIKTAMKMFGISLFLCTLVFILFSKQIAYWFIQDESIDQIVKNYFLIAGLGYFIHVFTTCFLAGLNGMGRTFTSMILYIFYFLCVRVPIAYIAVKVFHMGLNGVWVSFLISHFAAIITAFLLYRYESHKLLQ